jgi:hypothetical protein
MPAQQRDKGRVEKARVADLDRVPQIPPAFGPRPGAAGEPVVTVTAMLRQPSLRRMPSSPST